MSNPYAGIRWVWSNGQLVEFTEATLSVLSHALHYGSGVIEGIRVYDTPQGPAAFRLYEHIRRLEDSCKVYRMPLPYSAIELADGVWEAVKANEITSGYVRLIAFRGFGTLGVNPLRSPIEVAIIAWNWGEYLGEEEEEGIDVCISSWRRPAPDALPLSAKSTGSYINSQLIKTEAICNGYVEGIALDASGFVSEGSGENIFLVHDGNLLTPPTSASLIPGITRDTVITLAHELGIPVLEEQVTRAQIYVCDELFLTGTAAQIVPVRSVDRIPVGTGKPGEVTRRLMAEFRDTVQGQQFDRHGWQVPLASAKRSRTSPPSAPSRSAGRFVEGVYRGSSTEPDVLSSQDGDDVRIVVAWDPEVISEEDYGSLIAALGDLVRAEGGVGVTRIVEELCGISSEVRVSV